MSDPYKTFNGQLVVDGCRGVIYFHDSLYRLKRAFESRLCDPYFPCVSDETPEDGGPEAYVYFRDPTAEQDPYPDRLLKYGPRGGLRLEYA